MQRFFSPQAIILILAMAYMSFTSGAFASPRDWLMGELYCLPGILIGLCFHEFGHAFVAYKLGDDTPKLQGRVNISPLSHVDPVGLIALIFVGFGWGKPVMINPANFKHRRRDELLVAFAGVVMNFLLAIVFAFALKLCLSVLAGGAGFEGAVIYMVYYAMYINLILMVFNLLPVPPLDGFNILVEIFNLRHTEFYRLVYDKGMFILLVLIVTNVTDMILQPAMGALMSFMGIITGLPFGNVF